VSATEPVTSVLSVALDPERETDEELPDEVDPDEVDPDEVDPDDAEVDLELLEVGPDWMEVGALVARGPVVEVL